jgi:hypothetical protein
MKMTFCFPVEMSDYNQMLRILSSVYNKKCLAEAHVMEFELTKIDKFIGVT